MEGNLSLPTIIGAIVLLIGGVITGTYSILNRRGAHRDSREPSWVELTTENRALREEMDEFRREMEDWRTRTDKKILAFGRVLSDINRQAPTGWVPVISKRDISILEDTIPTAWLQEIT